MRAHTHAIPIEHGHYLGHRPLPSVQIPPNNMHWPARVRMATGSLIDFNYRDPIGVGPEAESIDFDGHVREGSGSKEAREGMRGITSISRSITRAGD